ncbi:MAG: ATP-binding protein [Candidatus Aminicenantes bacterium]|nr:ATP-binding protein [Candidatus Aminicenantes bacterium]
MMEDLSLHILDIVENAVAADATRITVTINENERRNLLTVRISDNGRGMSKKDARRALDPFFTTKGKRTGLGLPLLAQAAEHCGGGAVLTTVPNQGTKVAARFRYRHIDRPPLTAMVATITALVFGHPEIDFRYGHRVNGLVFRFASREFLGDPRSTPCLCPSIFRAAKKNLQTGLKKIGRT